MQPYAASLGELSIGEKTERFFAKPRKRKTGQHAYPKSRYVNEDQSVQCPHYKLDAEE